eukprot:SAG31_NODE_114_length_24318_cov_16.787481_19_plen_185_part_00
MITEWRQLFNSPRAYFGFIQLSTWCQWVADMLAIADMREAQMSALALPMVGYATNADHGAGCNVHPPAKQYCSKRLADSALALNYGRKVSWRSPSFVSSTASATANSISVIVAFKDVSAAGLTTDVVPFNSGTVYGGGLVNCTKLNAAQPDTCAWATIQLHSGERLNATVSVASGRSDYTLMSI